MSKRSDMVATDIRRAVAPILRECPRECGVVSMTEISVSEDLGVATIYVSALSSPESALAFLKKKKGEMRLALASLEFRRVPELRFKIDPRSERGSRIEKLLEDETS